MAKMMSIGSYIEDGQTRRRFGIPEDFITQTTAILAVKRSGKSNAAVVLAEQMYDHGLPWVAIDPKGDWWGIQADGPGRKGLPILVLGGLHGNMPLEPTAGAVVADFIVENRLTCVLDVSEFTKADQIRFLLAFVDRLYRTNTEPLHVFCEEADEYIPQTMGPDETKLVRAFTMLVKRGGFRGLGCTLITQRSASLNKNVLTQIETLFAMRTPSPQDRKAIEGWLDMHETGREILRALPKMPNGEAYVISPQWLGGDPERILFKIRGTYDSGATPKIGESRPPVKLADVDLDKIREAMADTVEQVKANDPKHLKAEIVRLTKAVADGERRLAYERSQHPEPERIEVPVLDDGTLKNRVYEILGDMVKANAQTYGDIYREIEALYAKYPPVDLSRHMKNVPTADQLVETFMSAGRKQGKSPMASSIRSPGIIHPNRTIKQMQQAIEDSPYMPPKAASAPRSTPTPGSTPGDLTGPQRKILTALAQHGPKEKTSLAILTGYSHKGGGFNNPLSALRTLDYINRGNPIEITQEGVDALGDFEPLPTGSALFQWWHDEGGLTGPEKKILAALVELGGTADKASLAEQAGYDPSGGGFNNPLSRLRTLGIVQRGQPIQLTEEMYD